MDNFYKPHGLFTQQLYDYLDKRMPTLGRVFNRDTAHEIVRMSRMGLLPEAAEIPSDSPYWPEMRKLMESHVVSVADASAKPPPILAHDMAPVGKFAFGKTSLDRLSHLMSPLRDCFMLAITMSEVDMMMVQTIRSLAEQTRNVANGASRTMKSKHLPQADGFAHAGDVAAFVNGKISWEEKWYAEIAYAMDKAATKLGVAEHVRWGAAWDRVLSDFGGNPIAYHNEANAYAKRHAGSDLIDMPHFEWVA